MTGRLIAVVGPSGVGKDTVMRALVDRDSSFKLVRRVITRPSAAGGEEFDGVQEDAFAQLVAADAFCLHWRAHGLSYGIPASINQEIAIGTNLLVNLSRSVLVQADALFDNFLVINLTADYKTLAARVTSRGRETGSDITDRLSRTVPNFAPQIDVRNIANDGPIGTTVDKVMAEVRSHAELADTVESV